jgi:diguanylate cyclase (GGDEF)-like protein
METFFTKNKEIELPLPQILLDSIPVGVMVTNTSLELVQANHWVTSNTKIIMDEVIGHPLGEIFPELASRNLLEAYKLVLHGGMPLTLSNRIHRYFFKIPARGSQLREMPQTAIISPIRSGDQIIGTLTFITDVTERVNVENSLKREVDKLNTLHEIDRAVSTLDFERCLQVIVQRTRVLFNSQATTLYFFEQKELKIAASDGQIPSPATTSELVEWVASNRQKASSPDLQAGEAHCQMAAPLIVHENCIGVLDVQPSPTEAFSAADLDLLNAIANRAAIAIHNARLHASERHQRELAESMREISLTLAAELDLEAVLDAILKSVARVVSYDAACILLKENELLRVKRHLGFELPGNVDAQTLLENYLNNSNLIRLVEMSKQPEVQYGGIRNPRRQSHDLEKRLNTWAVAPIVMRGKQLGYLLLGKKEAHAYNLEAAVQLAVFASSAGIAIENARSFSLQQNMAVTDGLTGLNNRRHFDDELNREMERVARYKRPTSLIMMDIDNYKRYNDAYGHQAGDVFLKHLAILLRKNTRDVDVVARYGGEEFAIILPEVGLDGARVVAERIRTAVTGMHLVKGVEHLPPIESAVTISLGVACAPSQANSPAELIHAADTALFVAKHNGKNQTVLYDLSIEPLSTGLGPSR